MSRSGWTSRSACSPSSGTSSESRLRSTNRAPEWRNGIRAGLKNLSRQRDVSSSLTSGIDLGARDRKSTRLNSSHGYISYAVFCLKKKKNKFLPDRIRDQKLEQE